jgi:hypothetical protein
MPQCGAEVREPRVGEEACQLAGRVGKVEVQIAHDYLF